jgi:multiple sugar transport system substrate-binding protein
MSLVLVACAPAANACASAPSDSASLLASSRGEVIFLSTQFKPPREIEQFRRILRGAPMGVEFNSLDTETFNHRLDALQQAGKVSVSLVGGQYGDLVPFQHKGYLQDLTTLMSRLSDRQFPEKELELSRMGTDQHYYVPWTKATFVLAVNKKAEQYKPQGTDVNALTYRQLQEWGERILRETGQPKLGFPAGPNGLLHRLFQGYLYPSYTGSVVTGFKSQEAEEMWGQFAAIWRVTNPASTTYDSMQEPLDRDEVWIAWDHIARLVTVVEQRPPDFLLAPAPAGPKGRGFMVVPSGLAVPTNAPNREGAERLIEYLTEPARQLATLCNLWFVPASGATELANLPRGLQVLVQAIAAQEAASDGLPVLPPIGLGDKHDQFNDVYRQTFHRIVLANQAIPQVLESQDQELQTLIKSAGVP